MTISYTTSGETVAKILIAVLLIVVFWMVIIILFGYGDDTESDLGLCLRGYKDHCTSQKLQHDLEGSLMIWNSANCSQRDICTPQTCFANKELADLYIKEFGNDTGNVKVPCPPFEAPRQEGDEGK